MTGKRAVIVGAAPIGNYKKISSYLKPGGDFYIFCDGGLSHLQGFEKQLGCRLAAHLVVGDFDSHPVPHNLACPVIHLPCQKDDTDTWFAVKEAIRGGFTQFLLLGVVGGRLDHTMGNLSILLYLYQQGFSALLVDDYSEMEVVGQVPAEVSPDFSYFSLLNINGDARDVSIRNAMYPLDMAELTPTYQYAISNQVMKGQVAEIRVGEGCLLLTRIF